MALNSTGQPNLLQTLTPTSAAAAAVWGRQQRPFKAGYNMRVRAEGAQSLYGVNYPGSMATNVYRFQGNGAAANSSAPYTYTIPSTWLTANNISNLPEDATTSIATGSYYLDCLLIIYQAKSWAESVLGIRTTYGAAFPAASQNSTAVNWQVASGGTSILLSYKTDGTNWYDLPQGWLAELIYTPQTSLTTALVTASGASETVAQVTDFMAAGDGTHTNSMELNRIFQ